jgi:hypothetical protein
VSTLLRAIVYVFLHSLLNVLVQIANKVRLQRKYCIPEKRPSPMETTCDSSSFQNVLHCLFFFLYGPFMRYCLLQFDSLFEWYIFCYMLLNLHFTHAVIFILYSTRCSDAIRDCVYLFIERWHDLCLFVYRKVA